MFSILTLFKLPGLLEFKPSKTLMSNPPNVTHLWIPYINETQLSILMPHFHIIHEPYPANDVQPS